MSKLTLKQKADQVLAEKNAKVISDNIKSGVTLFGVQGTYAGGQHDPIGYLFMTNVLEDESEEYYSISSFRYSTDGYKPQEVVVNILKNDLDEDALVDIPDSPLRVIDFGYVYTGAYPEYYPYIVLCDFNYAVRNFSIDLEDPSPALYCNVKYSMYNQSKGLKETSINNKFSGAIQLNQNFIVLFGEEDRHEPQMGTQPSDDYLSLKKVEITREIVE